jgi:hypothetical protein
MSKVSTLTARNSITTKYLGPTNTRCARIKATCGNGGTITVSYDHALDGRDNHDAAAKALSEQFFPVDAYGVETLLLRVHGHRSGWMYVTVPLGLQP